MRVLRPIVIYLLYRLLTVGAMAITAAITHESMRQELDRWDGRWFLRAAAHGWPSRLPMVQGHVAGNTVAFFPLFPLAIRGLAAPTGLSLLSAGVVISGVTGLTAMVAVWALVRRYAGSETADRATLLLAVFPGAFVFSLVYSEGITLTCVAFGLLALLRRQWWLAGVLGLLATATSPIALAFVVSCAWCAGHEILRHRNWRSLIAPVLAPLGFLGYMLWLWWHTGVLSAWRLTERGGWHSYPSARYALHVITSFVADPVAATKTGDLLFAGTVVAIIGAVIAIRQRLPMPVLIYGLVAAAMAMIAAPIGLRPRFLLLAFPLILAIGARLRGWAFPSTVAVSAVLLVTLTVVSASSFTVFP